MGVVLTPKVVGEIWGRVVFLWKSKALKMKRE